MEGTLAFGGERWLRDLGTAESGLVLERWWVDHRLRTVAIGGGGNELTRKGSEKGEAIPSSLKIVGFLSYCFWVMICLLNCSFFLEFDTEYRYWSFTEALCAHNSLPAKSKLTC